MAELTGRQRRVLRGIGQELPSAATIGKAGLTPSAVENIRRLLDAAELLKVRLPAEPPKARKETAGRLAEAVGAELVGLVGRSVLLYRANEALAPEKRIRLDGQGD
jgi:RNA-binding protein